jgi:hypothetical protein
VANPWLGWYINNGYHKKNTIYPISHNLPWMICPIKNHTYHNISIYHQLK